MFVAIIIIAGVIPYLIGSVNFSILLSKAKGKDIRESGSGNAGATNMLRTYGKGMAVVTLILDILKGVLCVFFGSFLAYACQKFIIASGSPSVGISVSQGSYNKIMAALPYFKYICGLFVVIGHNFPIFFKFKGGKGVATSLGVICTLNWVTGLIVLVFALLTMVITRYVSLGSIIGAVVYIAVTVTTMVVSESFDIFVLLFTVLLSALLILRHKENILRLKNGSEHKLGKKSGD